MEYNNFIRNLILDHTKERFKTEPEYPWFKFPNYAVLRHRDNLKWYGVIINIPKQKLGLEADGIVDIINVKCDPMLIGSLLMNQSYLPAYHMNKEHWISILLDGSVPVDEIFHFLNLSFNMTKKEKSKTK